MALLEQLEIDGYRPFDHLEVRALTRVNLIVGKNNAGKTALLEAVELLVSGGDPFHLARGPRSRGETFPSRDRSSSEVRVAPRHWFRSHSLDAAPAFEISGGGRTLTCGITTLPPPGTAAAERQSGLKLPASRYGLSVRSSDTGEHMMLPLDSDGTFGGPSRRGELTPDRHVDLPINFVTTGKPDVRSMAETWAPIQLTAAQDDVHRALTLIDPSIRQLAFQVTFENGHVEGIVRRGDEPPIPLGSLGEGVSRMLALALQLVTAPHGYLLVDEIDTGLHYSVMADMWRLVVETANRLDVQVFATTHSLDCVNALAWLVEEDARLSGEVSLHRLERGYEKTTPYTAGELAAAAEYHSELR